MSKYKNKIQKWMRYVDDVWIIWEGNDKELQIFFEKINNLEENITFKMEVGKTRKYISWIFNIRITGNNKLIFIAKVPWML